MTYSNNPFQLPPTQQQTSNILNPFNQDPLARFPAVDLPNSQQQPLQGQVYTTYSLPSQPQQNHYASQPAQSTSNQGFKPSSSFGQNLQAQMNQHQQYQHIQDLDPYGNIPQTWQSQPVTAKQPSSLSPQPTQSGPTNYGAHPRSVVENNKSALERWDTSAWRTFISRLEELKRAWEKRKETVLRALDGQGGRSLAYDEVSRFQVLLSDADEKIDLLTASLLQLKEVHEGYQQSSDAPSRARVRTALNESLRSWPDWPEDLYTGPSTPNASQTQLQNSQIAYQQTGMQQPQFNTLQVQTQATGYPQSASSHFPANYPQTLSPHPTAVNMGYGQQMPNAFGGQQPQGQYPMGMQPSQAQYYPNSWNAI